MGRAIVAGGKPAMEAPSAGILASELAVGSTVKLMENGSAVEYLVVHNGLPSSLYDSSCNGLWLLRKDVKEASKYGSSSYYEKSTVHTYLNGTFLNTLGATEQSVIKQVKIPYVYNLGNTVYSGSSGLSAKVFLLSTYEVGANSFSGASPLTDGIKLDYFASGTSNSANAKRVAYLNGTASNWWTRTPDTATTSGNHICYIHTSGQNASTGYNSSFGVRPALIIPKTAVFDADTLLLKEVA